MLIDYNTDNNNFEVYAYNEKEKMHVRQEKDYLWNYLR